MIVIMIVIILSYVYSYDDLVVGSPYFSNSLGRISVLFGSPNVCDNAVNYFADLNGADGFSIFGMNEMSYFGWTVSGGDVNNDGM
jgi:hypothetical protein